MPRSTIFLSACIGDVSIWRSGIGQHHIKCHYYDYWAVLVDTNQLAKSSDKQYSTPVIVAKARHTACNFHRLTRLLLYIYLFLLHLASMNTLNIYAIIKIARFLWQIWANFIYKKPYAFTLTA